MTLRLPTTLKLTLPLVLLGLVALLATVNALRNLPRAEQAAERQGRAVLAQEISRLQSAVEYLLLRGDLPAAQHQVSVLSHNRDYQVAALTDDRQRVIAATRRAWIDRPLSDVLAGVMTDSDNQAIAEAVQRRRATVIRSADRGLLFGASGVHFQPEAGSVRGSRTGGLVLVYDLEQARAALLATMLNQTLYWSGSVALVALSMWLFLHLVLTRRAARLVATAERLAGGDLKARSGIEGHDELGRLGQAFDAMARQIDLTQTRLRQELAEHDAARRALLVSEASYRVIFEASEDAFFIHDIDTGAILDANPRACQNFGYSLSEMRALDIGALGAGKAPHTQVEAMALIRRAAAGECLRVEWRSRHRDGPLRWDEIFIKRVTIGGVDRILAIARDITDKKLAAENLSRQRETLHQREKLAALGSLLAGVAHELNNPLSVVVARSVLLEERGDPSARAAAQKIRAAAERCARIVRTFLAMARRQRPERRAVALEELIAEVLDLTAYPLRSAGIAIRVDCEPDLPLVQADSDQLHQVLLNLVINAQQALLERAPPRRLAVSARHQRAHGRILLAVEDNGPGVAPELHSRIFEPYFTTKPMGVGIGVGLAVSQGIVEAHGGSLTLETPSGGGARFVATLPVALRDDRAGSAGDRDVSAGDGAGSAGEGEGEGTGSGAGEASAPGSAALARSATDPVWTVLLVDDEEEVRQTLVDIIAGAGHRVTAAESGRRALALMERQRFDVILTDLRMADIDGRQFHAEVLGRWPAMGRRCVFVTGDSLDSSLRVFASDQGCALIDKPFLPGEVLRVLAQAAAGSLSATSALP